VIAAIVGAAIIGGDLPLRDACSQSAATSTTTLTAIGEGKAAPPVDIITGNLPSGPADLYLFVVFAAIYVCCARHPDRDHPPGLTRMARDGKLPFSRVYTR